MIKEPVFKQQVYYESNKQQQGIEPLILRHIHKEYSSPQNAHEVLIFF